MPRSTFRGVFIDEIFTTMELVIQLIEVDPCNDYMKLLDDLWEVYVVVLQCRYVASYRVSAGRHLTQNVSILYNLIMLYPGRNLS